MIKFIVVLVIMGIVGIIWFLVKKDDSNPFALDQEREFNDFIKLIS